MNSLHLGWPQVILVALMFMRMGVVIARLGEVKKSDRYDLGDLLAPFVVTLPLLWWGGFFAGCHS